MSGSVKREIEKLREEILRHNGLYYTKGEPGISDGKYDEMLARLKFLENEYPEYMSPDSPKTVGGAGRVSKEYSTG
ncbi:MAG: hypothetical protein ABH883_03975 [Candidatus Omnitrophota bacterium]